VTIVERLPITGTEIIALGLIMLVSLLMGCQQQNRELTAEQKALRLGSQLFDKSCASCHGARGNGLGSRGGPSLQGPDFRYGNTPDAIRQSILQGRPDAMPAFDTVFTAEELDNLTDYVVYLGTTN